MIMVFSYLSVDNEGNIIVVGGIPRNEKEIQKKVRTEGRMKLGKIEIRLPDTSDAINLITSFINSGYFIGVHLGIIVYQDANAPECFSKITFYIKATTRACKF